MSVKFSKLDIHQVDKLLEEVSQYCRLCLVNKGKVDIQNDEMVAKFFKLNIELVSLSEEF